MKAADPLGVIAVQFALLSLTAFGGFNSITPELHRQAVAVQHWMSDSEFASLYAFAQAAPGPNCLVATLVGWRAAGLWGAVVATLAACAPSSLLALWVGARIKAGGGRWIRRLGKALGPIAVGLVAATAWVLTRGADATPRLAVLTAGVAAASLARRFNPLWALGCAAVLGGLGFV